MTSSSGSTAVVEYHVDLAGREARQREIDINIDRSEFAELELQDF